MDTGIEEIFVMKTIEERADEYIGHPYEIDEGGAISGMRNAFCMGAASEHEELTRWHDPKVELPHDDRSVLIILRAVSSDKMRYAVGCYRRQQWVGFAIGHEEVVGWREIHEHE